MRGRSAQAYFQASLLAERDGHWVLARTYAEKAKAHYEELSDRANVGRLLNNLGGLEFLLGKPEQAIEHLKRRPSRSPSSSDATRRPQPRSRHSLRCISAPATCSARRSRHCHALQLHR